MSTTDKRDPMPATPTIDPAPEAPDPHADAGAGLDSALSRRGFLRVSALAGLGATAATVAACTTGAAPAWTFPPAPSINPAPSPSATAAPSVAPSASATAAPSASASAAPSASASPDLGPTPAGWTAHDLAAREKVRRYLGKLAVPLASLYPPAATAKLAEILGIDPANPYPQLSELPEFAKVKQGNVALAPTIVGDTKVFDLTIDKIPDWQIDATTPPLAAMGYNGTWPGPVIRVTEGDKVRVNMTNNLGETTGTHMHGIEFDDFFMDGVPFVTQLPQVSGSTETYEFLAKPFGSMMYHSHHNATEQVGHGLLGAMIVEPKDQAQTYKQKYGVTQEYIWISNDSVGGFTINGHGFPATVPVVAAIGDKVLIRFMNEGIMMHPWHLHGYRMHVVARAGADLGSASFYADTLGVNPGERWDAIITVDRPGIWAFHCHILPHVEGPDGMFGMVNTLVVTPKPVDLAPLLK
jgi:hypothetical protein